MRVKFIIVFLFCCFIGTLLSAAVPPNWVGGPDESWYVSLEDALQAAAKGNKKVFVLRTGSDWCGYCIKLKKDVLSNRKFKKFAEKNLILVYLDFPRRSKMPKDQRAYNANTAKKLGFGRGVPEVLILDKTGKVIARRSGYSRVNVYMKFLRDAVEK